MELRMDELMAYAAKKEAAVKTREELQQLRNKFYLEHNDGPLQYLKRLSRVKPRRKYNNWLCSCQRFLRTCSTS